MKGAFGAELIQVIKTTLEIRGHGTEESPMRRITQYWSLDGELLAEVDPKYRPGQIMPMEKMK